MILYQKILKMRTSKYEYGRPHIDPLAMSSIENGSLKIVLNNSHQLTSRRAELNRLNSQDSKQYKNTRIDTSELPGFSYGDQGSLFTKIKTYLYMNNYLSANDEKKTGILYKLGEIL